MSFCRGERHFLSVTSSTAAMVFEVLQVQQEKDEECSPTVKTIPSYRNIPFSKPFLIQRFLLGGWSLVLGHFTGEVLAWLCGSFLLFMAVLLSISYYGPSKLWKFGPCYIVCDFFIFLFAIIGRLSFKTIIPGLFYYIIAFIGSHFVALFLLLVMKVRRLEKLDTPDLSTKPLSSLRKAKILDLLFFLSLICSFAFMASMTYSPILL